MDKWFILKKQNWKLPTCDSFPLIVSQFRSESSGTVWWQWLRFTLTAPPHVSIGADDIQEKPGRKLQTRRFLNHEFRLLLQSHTFAIIVILGLTPCLLRWYLWIYLRIIMGIMISLLIWEIKLNEWMMSKFYDNTLYITDHISQTFAKRSITLNEPLWPLTPHMLMSHVQL